MNGETQTYRLGDLQLRIMKVLWKLSTTTVATMLRKMEDRGLVRHREDGRKFIYESAVSEDDVSRSMADDLVDRLFEGSLSATVSHLLEHREVDQQELARLERLIKAQKKQR